MALAVSGEQFPGSIQMRLLADTGENIENFSPVRPGVLHTVRGQDRQSIMRGKIDKLLINAFLSPQKMSLNFNKNILTPEYLDQKLHALLRFVGRLTHLRPLTRPDGLPVHIACVPAAPFCEKPGKIGV